MEIKQVKGKLNEKDILFLVNTKQDEPFTLLKLLTLIKLLRKNELILKQDFLEKGECLFFEEAIKDIFKGKTLENIAKSYFLNVKDAKQIDEDIKIKKLSFFVR